MFDPNYDYTGVVSTNLFLDLLGTETPTLVAAQSATAGDATLIDDASAVVRRRETVQVRRRINGQIQWVNEERTYWWRLSLPDSNGDRQIVEYVRATAQLP